MKYKKHILLATFVGLVIIVLISFSERKDSIDDKVVYYIADSKLKDIEFYWKDGSGNIIRSIQNLEAMLSPASNYLYL